jgi:hypothetical protein
MAPKAKADSAKEILDKADDVLRQVDGAFIFQDKKCREFPKFAEAEIESGPLLGKGGFSGVHEVVKIQLEGLGVKYTKEDESDEQAIARVTNDPGLEGHEAHYKVETAREFMAKHCIRIGSSRYAIKRLKSDLGETERARGALDLAIEVKFLSAIWHPNIGEHYMRVRYWNVLQNETVKGSDSIFPPIVACVCVCACVKLTFSFHSISNYSKTSLSVSQNERGLANAPTEHENLHFDGSLVWDFGR